MRASGTPRFSAAARSPIRRAADLTVPGEGASRPSSPGAVSFDGAHGARGFAPASARAGETPGVLPSVNRGADARPSVELSDTARAFLAIVAAHDHVSAETFLTGAICRRLEEIGLSRALDLIDESSPDAVSISPASTSPSVATDSMLPASDGAFYFVECAHGERACGPASAMASEKSDGVQSDARPSAGTRITPAEKGREEVPSGLLPVPRAPP